MRNRGLSSRTLASVAVLSLIGVIGLSACSAAPNGATSATADQAEGRAAQAPSAAAANGQSLGNTGSAQDAGAVQADLLTGEAVIRTGAIALRSGQIDHVLVRVYGIVGGVGGDVSSENTATDQKGNVVRSTLALRVPVGDFDTTLNDLSRLGTLVDRVRSSKDVTTAVADIDSRVRSAQQTIITLRGLFHRATRLGDVIRLESELSQREADLESLQAQQRALHDKTTMSTITMTVELPPATSNPPPTHDQHQAGGFVSGIHQGWHALTRTVIAIGHGVGIVLPLGIVGLLLAALGLWFVRRFVPRPAPAVKTTVES